MLVNIPYMEHLGMIVFHFKIFVEMMLRGRGSFQGCLLVDYATFTMVAIAIILSEIGVLFTSLAIIDM